MPQIQAHNGQPIEIKLGESFRLTCCDCSLVHDVLIQRPSCRLLTITFSRNSKLTHRRRKSKKENHR